MHAMEKKERDCFVRATYMPTRRRSCVGPFGGGLLRIRTKNIRRVIRGAAAAFAGVCFCGLSLFYPFSFLVSFLLFSFFLSQCKTKDQNNVHFFVDIFGVCLLLCCCGFLWVGAGGWGLANFFLVC